MRVMIIDDEQPCLDELQYLLMTHEDIDIIGAYTNPLEALVAIPLSRLDVAFIDIAMPYIDGMELAKKIYSMDSSAQVVFVTAHSKLLEEQKRAPPLEFILKPINEKKLEAVVKKLRLHVSL